MRKEIKSMIVVQDLQKVAEPNVYLISAFADTKDEVGTSNFEGLPSGARIHIGSSVFTASGELAFMKSDGQWNWL